MDERYRRQAEFLFNIRAEDLIVRRVDKSGEDCRWRKNRQKHNFFELIYAVNAQADIELEDRIVTLNPNDMILYPLGVCHKEIPNPRHTQQIISMAVEVECGLEFDTAIHIPSDDGVIGGLFENCVREFNAKKENYIQLIQSYVKAIFTYAGRQLFESSFQKGSLLNRCTSYIKKHYSEDLSIAQLESVFCVSGSYISRVFSKKYDMGVMQYLNVCRIDEAKKLLSNEKYTVAMVAMRVGFRDPLYFSKVFKKHEGIAPLQYRKKICEVVKNE